MVGAALGYELGLFTARLMAGARLLPAQTAEARAAPLAVSLAVSPEVVPSAEAR